MTTTPPAGVDPRDLRVSDAERTHVLQLLERATGRGLIDIGEYTERSGRVIEARTRGELNAVLVDLPGLQIAGRSIEAAQAATAPPPSGPGFSGAPGPDGYFGRSQSQSQSQSQGWARGWDDGRYGPPAAAAGTALELTGWGSREFKGFWVAPERIVVGGTGASTKLDFTSAQLTSPVVTVEFRGNYGGAAEFVIPAGSGVRMDGLQMRGGSLRNKIQPVPASWSPPLTLVLTGMKKAGSVTVRPPRTSKISSWF